MTADRLVVECEDGQRRVPLAAYLPAALEETATVSANAWIKELRTAAVDGHPMRRRFTYRGDSLWWFTELYLHKTQVIDRLFRTILALEQVLERERPRAIAVEGGSRLLRGLAPQLAAARQVRYRGRSGFGGAWARLARLDARARALHVAAMASRLRRRTPAVVTRPAIAAFVHRAFWKTDGTDGSAESYIGPVLAALERLLARDAVAYVGVGPTENFAARRWWRARLGSDGRSLVPIERFAPLGTLRESRRLWRDRYRLLRALWNSADLRQRAVIHGCDCWPVVREELAGVALLQWPWSARAMDEAAAVLDTLQPESVVTYAEAGGWGRALMLEARRRGVPSAGLQHGFIYRHWLNYQHEADEMQPDPGNPADAGFPAPALTMLFDAYAADHLDRAGHFPPSSLAVTGSARLDGLAASAWMLSDEDLARTRVALTGSADGRFVLLVTKYRQAHHVLPALVEATRAAGVRLAIKTHPAETPDVYAPALSGAAHVVVIPSADLLAPLLRASGAVVTVNSTVALDAAVLGVPALVIGLPNNLSPFVEAGIMAGAPDGEAIARALHRILYDQEFLDQLAAARSDFLDRFGMRPDGRAAERAADAIVRLKERPSRCGF